MVQKKINSNKMRNHRICHESYKQEEMRNLKYSNKMDIEKVNILKSANIET